MFTFVRATTRLFTPLAGRRFFPLWAVLHHRGRRTGRAYAAPVGLRVTPDAFTIALPFGERTQWVHNVMATGECTIRWKGRDYRATEPRVIGSTEAESAFNPVLRTMMRALKIQTCLTMRRAPIV